MKILKEMTAHYPGKCCKCGETHVSPGDEIIMIEGLGWCAKTCIEAAEETTDLILEIDATQEELEASAVTIPEFMAPTEAVFDISTVKLSEPIINVSDYDISQGHHKIHQAITNIRSAMYTHLRINSAPESWNNDLKLAINANILDQESADRIRKFFLPPN